MTGAENPWPVVDREAALAHPPERIPRKVIYWGLAALVVLGGGGLLLEHLFSSVGLNQYSVTAGTPTTTTTTTPAAASAASLRSFMQIAQVDGAAPALTLTGQDGASVGLDSLRGQVVVLTFFDAACDDVCPVLGQEIADAESALGSQKQHVAFVAVNTDPQATSETATAHTTAALGLAAEHNWYFLTGPLAVLDPVWTHYGITIEVSKTTHRVTHTDLMYFIDAQGREHFTATPFANESRTGVFRLDDASIQRFGLGIADYARQLLH